MCYLHFTDKEGNEGKGLVAGDKGLSQYFFKLPGGGILKSNLIMECDKCLTEDRRG